MRARLQFMVLGILTAGVALFWFDAAQSRRLAVKNYAARLDRKRELGTQIENLEKRSAHAVDTQTAMRAQEGAKPEASNSPTQSAAARRRLNGGVIFGTKAMASDPNLQRLDLERHHARIALEYDEFFKTSGLSATEIERFTATVLKGAELKMDLNAIGETQDAAGKRAMAAFQEQTETEHEAELQGVLGPDRYHELREFERTQFVRTSVVNSFAGTAALAGVPLTPGQGDKLLQAALTAANDEGTDDGSELLVSVDLTKLDTQARQILTPAQFQVFVQGNSARKQMERSAVMKTVRDAEEAQRK